MRDIDKPIYISVKKKYLKMIQERWKAFNTKPELREIEIVYLRCDGLTFDVCYADGEVVDFIEIKSKCFLKKFFNHWINGGKIMMRNDDDWLVLVKENNENN